MPPKSKDRLRWHGANCRGSAVLAVLLAIAIAGVVLVSLQGSSFAQAAAGREAVARLHAKWAARAGIESTISRFERNILNRDPNSALTEPLDMQDVAYGELDRAVWDISHIEGKKIVAGPEDAHAKLNISLMTEQDLASLPNMSEDISAAILDWVDADDNVRELGAEEGYYLRLPSPYKPRNAPFKSIAEIELVAGVYSQDVRGEDWNLNGRLDPNEDDRAESWPDDNADGALDQGWSGLVTTYSVDEGLASDGKARLYLATASADQVVGRIKGLTNPQAQVILDHASKSGAALQDFISTPLVSMTPSTIPRASVSNLDTDQIKSLLDDCTLNDPGAGPKPGRLNINTCQREELDYIPEISAGTADLLIFERNRRATGFTHIMDLAEVGVPASQVGQLAKLLDVRSNSYVVTCRGKDTITGIEVEMQAVISRTELPVPMTEVLVR